MLPGLGIGLLSAVLQSTSYCFSRNFVLKHPGNAWKLSVYSQLWMTGFSLLALAVISPWQQVTFTPKILLLAGLFGIFGNLAYFSFFRALQLVEASRLSSLLGLKIIMLTVVNALWFRHIPDGWQGVAILLSALAAVGMNFSGGKIPYQGGIFLGITLGCFAITDILAAEMVAAMPGNSLLLRSVASTGLSFGVLGVISSLAFFRMKFERDCMRDAFGYGICWFTAMIGLLASFNLLGVLLANIVQAGRGFFSVLLGALLLKCGFAGLEPPVSRKIWLRRGIMALLMILSMVLYMKGLAS